MTPVWRNLGIEYLLSCHTSWPPFRVDVHGLLAGTYSESRGPLISRRPAAWHRRLKQCSAVRRHGCDARRPASKGEQERVAGRFHPAAMGACKRVGRRHGPMPLAVAAAQCVDARPANRRVQPCAICRSVFDGALRRLVAVRRWSYSWAARTVETGK